MKFKQKCKSVLQFDNYKTHSLNCVVPNWCKSRTRECVNGIRRILDLIRPTQVHLFPSNGCSVSNYEF